MREGLATAVGAISNKWTGGLSEWTLEDRVDPVTMTPAKGV